MVAEHIQQLEIESRNPREGLLETLRQYKTVQGQRVGGIRTRVAPTVLSKLYKSGRSARVEVAEWLRSKELQRATICHEVLMLASILDRMMAAGDHSALINSQSAELTCLRMYAIWKAYDQVKCLNDWQRPKGQSQGKWKSKVDWNLAEEYLKIDGEPDAENILADDEVTEKLKRRANILKHLKSVNDGTPSDE